MNKESIAIFKLYNEHPIEHILNSSDETKRKYLESIGMINEMFYNKNDAYLNHILNQKKKVKKCKSIMNQSINQS
jgi:hypothetical protein